VLVKLVGGARRTSPGLAVRSQLLGVPCWKSLCDVSTKQPLVAAAERVKFCVAVPPSGTAIVEAEPVLKPAFAAVSEAYVPAGR
jgi:hypothetical protein